LGMGEEEEEDDDDDDDDAGMAGGTENDHRHRHRHRRGVDVDMTIRGHVISADSVQAYRDADIGSNKPTDDELYITPHHLIDVVDIIPASSNSNSSTSSSSTSTYNAADWMDDACYVIRRLAPPPLERDYDDEDCDHDSNCDVAVVKEEEEVGKTDVVDGSIARRRERIDAALRHSLAPLAKSIVAIEPIATTRDVDNNGVVSSSSSSSYTTSSVLPVVVGGTMMYLQWLVRGMPDAVRPTEYASRRAARVIDELRRSSSLSKSSKMVDVEVDVDVDVNSWEVASAHVSSLGPLFARRVRKLPGRDWYRLRRLLEVAYTIASIKMADNTSGDGREEEEMEVLRNLTEEEVYTGLRSGRLSDLGYDVRCFFLCPSDRMTHFHIVDDRCERMLMSGLLRETTDLCLSGAMSAESQVARAIGYRQALRYLRREDARRNDVDAFVAFVEDFMSATRQYAKKQMQWFRRDDEFAFVPIRMDDEKDSRVKNAAEMIANLCKLRREDFDSELRPCGAKDDGDCVAPPYYLSARTKLENERQGKTMKFFISRRVHLLDGTDEFKRVMAEADECTRLVQGFAGGEC
jgi:tRNA dimethylallyltransferase